MRPAGPPRKCRRGRPAPARFVKPFEECPQPIEGRTSTPPSAIPAISLELTAAPADNSGMTIAAKKPSFKGQKSFAKRSPKQRKSKPVKSAVDFDPVADAEACRKISQTLDLEAFDSFHEKNAASQRYWESKE
jgi:hypothetical protein